MSEQIIAKKYICLFKAYLVSFPSFHLFDMIIFGVRLIIDEFYSYNKANDDGINGYNLSSSLILSV